MSSDAVHAPVPASLGADAWRRLERLSRQLSRRQDEAEDLLQDVMLAALEAGRGDERWLQGVMRHRAAFMARGAARRKSREALAGESMQAGAGRRDDVAASVDARTRDPALAGLLARLPPASRRVLLLALHGLGAGEIQWLLRTSPTAFRQRVATIRREFRTLPAGMRDAIADAMPVTAHGVASDTRFGLRRRILVAVGMQLSSAGSHDPDGHLLLFKSPAHVSALRGNHDGAGNDGRPVSVDAPRRAGIP